MNFSEYMFFSNFYVLKGMNALSALSDNLTIYAGWYILPYMQSWNHCLLQLFSSLLKPFMPQETKATYGSINDSCMYAVHMKYIHMH